MTDLPIQLSMLGMTGRRKPSTPATYKRDFIARIRAARVMSGKSQEQMADELGVKKNTYQTWEIRTLMPHQFLIPFCDSTGADPYEVLTGAPFRIGRSLPSHPRPEA